MEYPEGLGGFDRQQAVLLEQIYRTPLVPGDWQGFLSTLVSATGARSARMLVMDRQAQEVHKSIKLNIDEDEHQRYVRYYVNRCPWRPELISKTPGRLYNSFHDFSCDQPSFYRTEFFNDWARHLDIEHGLCGTVYQDDHYAVQLLVQRTGGQGPFPIALTHRVNQLVPHVRQALQLGRQMNQVQAKQGLALAASERSFMPYLVIDAAGTILYACSRAEKILSRVPGVALCGKGLEFQCPRRRRRFHQALSVVAYGPEAGKTADTVMTLPGPIPPVRLLVTPLNATLQPTGLWPTNGVAAVYIQDPRESLTVNEPQLAELYGLTAAEARVAARVALGEELKAVALSQGVSHHTVRSQLKSVLRKTGTHRQSQLTLLVLRSAAVRDRLAGLAPEVGA